MRSDIDLLVVFPDPGANPWLGQAALAAALPEDRRGVDLLLVSPAELERNRGCAYNVVGIASPNKGMRQTGCPQTQAGARVPVRGDAGLLAALPCGGVPTRAAVLVVSRPGGCVPSLRRRDPGGCWSTIRDRWWSSTTRRRARARSASTWDGNPYAAPVTKSRTTDTRAESRTLASDKSARSTARGGAAWSSAPMPFASTCVLRPPRRRGPRRAEERE